jgi:predicted Zn-dependent protease
MIVGALTGLGLLSDARRRRTMVVTAVLVLISTVHAADRSMVWADDETLFVDLAERHPESFRAQWWIGGRFVDGGDLERGVTWLERAHQTNPNGALLALDYARALLLVNRAVEAEEVVRPIPIFLHPSQPVFLAQSLIVQGRRDEAAVVVREGLRAHPTEARLRDQARQLGIDEA